MTADFRDVIENMLNVISEVVHNDDEGMSAFEKCNAILMIAKDDGRINDLYEFCSWFDVDDEAE